jgi:hypothetical protein
VCDEIELVSLVSWRTPATWDDAAFRASNPTGD